MKKVMDIRRKTRHVTAVNSLTGTLVALALGGCAVGPDFKSPEAPVGAGAYSYTQTPNALQTEATEGKAGVSQKFVVAKDIPAQWWELFQSTELDALIHTALENSPSLASAQAALRKSQENYSALWGSTVFPNLSASYIPERDKTALGLSTGDQTRIYNLNTANLNVTYTFDVFGGNRRAREDLMAEVDYQRFLVEGAYLTLTSNLVVAAIQEASVRAQLEAQKEILEAQIKQLEVIRSRFIIGAIKKVDVLDQEVLVAQTRAAIPPLEKSLQQTRHQIAVLAGRLPSDQDLPTFSLDNLHLPEELPVSIPSELIRQRPDVRANEALLHRASAQVGVATANRYPQFTLTGFYGSSALNSAALFSSATEAWRIAGGITQTLFDGGSLSAKQRAAAAFYDQQDAIYRQTVLGAFQNVADALQALEFDARTLKEQINVVNAAKQNLELANLQFGFGAINSLTLLDVRRTYQQARLQLVIAQAARYTDTVALFTALGGGWWNRAELKDISVKKES